MIDWASDTFKALIAAAALWLASYIRKKIVPVFKALLRIAQVVERVDEIENDVWIVKSKQRAIMATDPNPTYITDCNSDLIYANPAWAEMAGFNSVEDAYGKGYLRAIPNEDVEPLEQMAERQVKHPFSFEGHIRFKNIRTGEIVNTICRSELVFNKDGKWIRTIGRLLILK